MSLAFSLIKLFTGCLSNRLSVSCLIFSWVLSHTEQNWVFVFQQYPDYYAIIKEPIDLKTIAQRIQV